MYTKAKIRLEFIFGLLVGVLLIVLTSCGDKQFVVEKIGKYQPVIYIQQGGRILYIVDTTTGATKIVEMAFRDGRGSQFDMPFDQMKKIPEMVKPQPFEGLEMFYSQNKISRIMSEIFCGAKFPQIGNGIGQTIGNFKIYCADYLYAPMGNSAH